MLGYGLEQIQRTSQVQVQRMSQTQIQAMNMLAMGSQDLRTEIYKEIENNPAIEIVCDPLLTGAENIHHRPVGPVDYTRLSNSSASGEEKAEHFQQMLENEPDNRETLQDHLLFQLNVMHLLPEERLLGENLIHNLDEKGFHILAPVSLLDKEHGQNQKMLERSIDLVQHMDPIGTCCTNTEESLLVQARITGKAPLLALFLLGGHLDMLDPPVVQKIQKKLILFRNSQKQLAFDQPSMLDSLALTAEEVEQALSFIRTLDPHPAQGFGSSPAQYIQPDVFIAKVPGHLDKDDFDNGVVSCGTHCYYQITLAHDIIPEVRIDPEFSKTSVVKDRKGFVNDAVRRANFFIENLLYRNSTIIRVCCEIVRIQMSFFEKGPGCLVPLNQRQLAERIGVHESTISRMAGSKYIQCEWGIFSVKYFFTNAVPALVTVLNRSGLSGNLPDSSNAVVSKEAVLIAIRKIIEMHSAKQLSDQKLAAELEKQGIKIARRTVAKYRGELALGSSYSRN
jgi:RNA polymerase sigma-54 factor